MGLRELITSDLDEEFQKRQKKKFITRMFWDLILWIPAGLAFIFLYKPEQCSDCEASNSASLESLLAVIITAVLLRSLPVILSTIWIGKLNGYKKIMLVPILLIVIGLYLLSLRTYIIQTPFTWVYLVFVAQVSNILQERMDFEPANT